jgi:putative transposase
MPRIGRIVLPGYPHHVVQRGHNRQAVFAAPADYQRYLDTLIEFKGAYGIKLYAWCLMTNHVHLLLDPGEEVAALGRLMKRLAGRQTRYHNGLEGRTGSLWEGRYKSSPVDSERYLLSCVRYIELNPVRARVVAQPQDHPWSSCRYRLGSEASRYLDEDPCYLELGATTAMRQAQYRAFLAGAIPQGEWALIRDAVQRGQLTGEGKFVDEVESILGRRIERRGAGRPAKAAGTSGSAR